ncbi:MAG: hypothetical protein V7L02_08570 [Nostoc sp.]|uniref:hypothetical protein n=1 Tax=Nostoc sp. TaxID=1180 RepID=UPI002FFBB2E0
MITASVQKSGKPLSPCLLHPCGLNDKSLPEHDIKPTSVGFACVAATSSRLV